MNDKVEAKLIITPQEVARQERTHAVVKGLCEVLDANGLAGWSFTICAWKAGSGEQPVLAAGSQPGSPTLEVMRSTAEWIIKCCDAKERGEPLPRT